MSDSDIMTSDTSDEESSSEILVNDSDSQEDGANESDSVIKVGKRAQKAIIETDDEDDEEEERAFSPRTRMSITGIRPKDLSEDSSEIDYSEEDEEPTTFKSGEGNYKNGSNQSEVYESANEETEEDEEEESKTNSFLEQSAEDETILESSSSSLVEPSVNQSKAQPQQVANLKVQTPVRVKQLINSPAAPRYSMNFERDIKEKLSSTIRQSQNQNESVEKNESHDSDIQVISVKEATIELSSSDDSVTINKESSTPAVVSTPKLIQPKILTALSTIPKSAVKTPSKAVKYVGPEYYNKELKKLDELKVELSSATKLLEKLSKSLPDGGRQIALRIDRLNTDLKIKENYVASLRIDDGSQLAQQQQQQTGKERKPFFNQSPPNWDDLSAAVNKIQPIHTGKQGMATFNNQKALTVERLKDLHGSLETRPGEDVLADDPEGLQVNLMNHQKHALAWMIWRENQKPRGGILADDMGLGKTLTMISLVLECKNRAADDKENSHSESESENEEAQETKKGWSSKGRRDYYQGGTLVVCPASLLRQWESEVQSKVARHKLTVCVHHGTNRDTKARHLRTYDIVVTTYNIVGREHSSQGCLFGMKWRRIILDEAHNVRNHKSLSSLAACALRGKYRWALTGTPIQNKEMDVYALLKFLRCTPFDDLTHWKRWIDKSGGGHQRLNTVINTLMLRRTKVQLQEYGTLQLPDKSIKLIEVELHKDEMNVYQKIMIYSRTLFAQFLFQRAERNTDLMYREQASKPAFMQNTDPNGAYFKIHQKLTKMHQEGGREKIKSHQILVLLLRLRQICCHPGLIDAMLEDENAQQIEDDDDEEDNHEIDLLEQLNKLAIQDISTGSNEGNESAELQPEEKIIAKASAKVLQRSNPVFNLNRPSSKMVIVLETLKKYVLNTNDKAIIVSQWTSVLNILKKHLEKAGVSTLSLNGSIAVKDRQAIVSEFNNMHSSKKVLLLSLTAGGVGLNLIGANHLFLLDLHWNPQLEAQAQDRIYRVGQKKNVIIYKFMCKDTVEERIKTLQDHKLSIANQVLTGTKGSKGSTLSIDDLKNLFGM